MNPTRSEAYGELRNYCGAFLETLLTKVKDILAAEPECRGLRRPSLLWCCARSALSSDGGTVLVSAARVRPPTQSGTAPEWR